MGSGEDSTPAKPSKSTASTQETPTTPSYPDWSTSLQAYYGAGATPPPTFFTSTVASPAPHPYLWGSQHLIPPYGTPLPYPAVYPHGVYAHPNTAAAQGAAVTTTEAEGKASEGKERVSTKKSKGSSGKESGKAAPGSGNDGASQSGESGGEGSSDASDENDNQQDDSDTKKRSFDQMLADGASVQNNGSATVETSFSTRGQPLAKLPVSVPGRSTVTMPATNLNIGMDLWNATPAGSVPLKARPNASGVSPAPVACEGVMPDHLWIQDERELKRQKRKQSNRESARRSRLRKQAECEELQSKVETLTTENHTLKTELQKLSEECAKLTSENQSLMEELTRLYGPEAIANIEDNNASTVLQSTNGDGNDHGEETSRENDSVSSQKNGNFLNSNGKLDSGSS
ncbi:PREDICTED: G-box-binding factor 1 [Nelumbo nucifera]|uniref:G-box-binding factor 1 n=1 Tax=Nelumbo nucifera TaxID=4432 RepID=A0A1U8Q2L7_NELNU|nr:PREDICTED: G-box-binding factor 1 [Nelumbo nucifera]XP_019053063.1 PREDICTED: G-box-binding factor 1 [Nelumbo nucifera]